jgi:hypothetical protein
MAAVSESAGQALERLIAIMRALRAPDGCPWDREQTPRRCALRARRNLRGAGRHRARHAGRPVRGARRFLFEAVFLSQINDEQGQFSMRDVARTGSATN